MILACLCVQGCKWVNILVLNILNLSLSIKQDYVRTSTYQRAMLQNHADFQDKVIGWYFLSLAMKSIYLLGTSCLVNQRKSECTPAKGPI